MNLNTQIGFVAVMIAACSSQVSETLPAPASTTRPILSGPACPSLVFRSVENVQVDRSVPLTPSDRCGPFLPPTEGSITSIFGAPRTGYSHRGLDIGAPYGTPVQAMAHGVVQKICDDEDRCGGFGRHVVIAHSCGRLQSVYAHMSWIPDDLDVDDFIRAGALLGKVGCSGKCTGPHLHAEVRDRFWNALDPENFISFGEEHEAQIHRGFGGRGPALQLKLRSYSRWYDVEVGPCASSPTDRIRLGPDRPITVNAHSCSDVIVRELGFQRRCGLGWMRAKSDEVRTIILR